MTCELVEKYLLNKLQSCWTHSRDEITLLQHSQLFGQVNLTKIHEQIGLLTNLIGTRTEPQNADFKQRYIT